MLACVTDRHLAATPRAAKNLLAEGVRREEIIVTGNTGIDSLLEALGRPDLLEAHRVEEPAHAAGERLVLITLHRRENWMAGEDPASPLEQVLAAVAQASAEFPAVRFVYPVHRNPRVQDPARRILGGRPNVHLLDPLPYLPFVDLMSRACLILTDSGGIQEEAPSLGVPVLVARETTERPEGVEAGGNALVGTATPVVLEALRRHLSRPAAGAGPRPRPNPFGDGKASGRILKAVLHHFGLGEAPTEFEPPSFTLSSVMEARA